MNTRKVRKILTPAITSVLVVTMTAGLALGMTVGGKALAEETYEAPTCDHETNFSDWVEINEETLPMLDTNASGEGGYTIELEDGKKYYLSEDVTANVYVASSATLCLNGHKLTGSGVETGKSIYGENSVEQNNSVINVQDGAVFILTDCSGEGSGVVTATDCNYGVICVNRGEAAVYGGTLTGNMKYGVEAEVVAGGAYVTNGGTLTMYGGIITGNDSFAGGVVVSGNSSDGETSFTMYGGAISGNTGYRGGGVYVFNDDASFVMYGGEVSGNESDLGGGVYIVQGDYALQMYGGKISGNTARKGGGVYVASGETNASGSSYFPDRMYGGEISGNEADEGAGVWLKDCEFRLTGGTIGDNVSSGDGGGVFVSDGATFSFRSGAVSDNKAAGNGGGICADSGATLLDEESSSDGANVSEISGNTAVNGGGIYLYDNAKYQVKMSGGDGSDFRISGNTAEECGGGLYGYVSSYSASGHSFTIEISENSAKYGGGIYSTVSFRTANDFTIFENCAEYGGGVYAEDGVNLYDSLYGNTATRDGGGVYATDGEVQGKGAIYENKAGGNGGGLYLSDGAFLTLTSGRSIYGNEAAGNGGGVYDVSGDIVFEGTSSVEGNAAGGSGGGIYMEGGTVTLSGSASIISGNIAEGEGGGIYMMSGSVNLSKSSTEISGNAAKGNGGGVYMYYGELVMPAGTVSGNTAGSEDESGEGLGGGLYLFDGTFTMTGGGISGNAAGYAGGVYMESGSVYLAGPVVIDGNSVTNGDGKEVNLYLHDADAYMTLTGALTGDALVSFACEYNPDDDGHAVIVWEDESYSENLLSHVVSENGYMLHRNVAEGKLEIVHVFDVEVKMVYGGTPEITVYDTLGNLIEVKTGWTAKYYVSTSTGVYEEIDDIESRDVGNVYYITVHVDGTDDYSAFDSDMTGFNISAKEITGAEIVFDGTLTYNVIEQTQGVKSVTIDGLDVTYVIINNSDKVTDAGEHTLVIYGTGNFTGEASAVYTVNPVDITKVKLQREIGYQFEYDGKEHSLEEGTYYFTYSYSDENGDSQSYTLVEYKDYTITSDSGSDVGKYNWYIYGIGNFTGSTNGYTEVTKKSIADASVAVLGTYTYNGREQELQISFTLEGFDSSDITYSVTYTKGDGVNAGKQVVQIKGSGNFTGTVEGIEYTICQADISGAQIDGGDTSVTYNREAHGYDLSAVYVEGIEGHLEAGVDFIITTTTDGFVDAKDYEIVIEGTGNFYGTATVIFTVYAADLDDAEVTFVKELEYNRESQTIEIDSVAIGSLILTADEYTVTEGTLTGTDAGEYSFTISAAAGNNNFTGSKVVTFEIRPFNIEGNAVVGEDGDIEHVYDGTDHGHKITSVTVTIGSDELVLTRDADYTVEHESDSFIDFGEYEVTITGIGNYTGTVTEIFYITKASVSEAEIEVGTMTYDGTEQIVVITSVTVEGVEVDITEEDYYIVNGSGKDAKTYTAYLVGRGNFDGYREFGFTIESFDLHEAKVTVESDSSFVYDGNEHSYEITSVYVGSLDMHLVAGTDYYIYVDAENDFTNAGDHWFTIEGTGNFTGETSVYFYIAPATLTEESVTVTLTEETLVYNGMAQKVNISSVIVEGIAGGLTEGTDYETVNGSGTDAGNYSYYIRGLNNFTGTVYLTFTIERLDLSDAVVIVNGGETKTFVYTGSQQIYEIDTVEVKGIGELTLTTDYRIYSGSDRWTDAGEYGVVIMGYGNYTGTYEVPFIIEAADITGAEVESESFTYNGLSHSLSVTVTLTGFGTLTRGTDYTTDGTTSAKDAGNYDFTVTGCGNFAGVIYCVFTIDARSIDEAFVETSGRLVYNGLSQSPTIIVTEAGLTLAEGVDYVLSGLYAETDAGMYIFTIEGKGNFTGSKYASYTIYAADIEEAEVSASEERTFVYDGASHTVEIFSVTLPGFDTLCEDTDYEISYVTAVNAGEYSVVISGINNFAGTNEISFTIEAFELTADSVTINGGEEVSFTYDGTEHVYMVSSVVVAGFDSVLKSGTDYKVTGEDRGTDAGTYTLAVEGAGNFSGTVSVSFVIARRDIGDAKVVTESAVYNGLSQSASPAVTLEGIGVLTYGDDYTLYGDFSAADAGAYTYYVVGTYNFTGYVECEFTISPLDIESGSVEITGTHVYDGKEQSPELVVTGTGFTLTLGTDYDLNGNYKGVDAGEYDFTVTGKGNFTGEIEASFTITPASIESGDVVLSWDTATYDGKEHSPEVTSVTLEPFGELSFGIEYSVSAVSGKDADTYAVTVNGVGNFAGTVTAYFTITPASIESGLDVTLSANTLVYDGTVKTVSVSSVTLKGFYGVLVEGRDYFVSGTFEATDAGTYNITITGDGNFEGTFDVSYTIESFSLSSASVTVNGGEYESFTYDGKEHVYVIESVAVAGISGNLEYGTDYTVTDGTDRGTYAGSYTLVIVGEGNFTGSYGLDFTILPASLEYAVITSENLTYSGRSQGVSPAVAMEGMGTLALYADYALSGETYATNAGTYTYYVVGIGNFTGMVECTFTIDALDIKDASVYFEKTYTYDGTAKTPDFTVTVNGLYVTYGWAEGYGDFTATDAGTYELEIYGTDNFTGSLKFDFVILQRDISGATVESGDDKVYTGTAHDYDIEHVIVSDGTIELYLDYGVDYDIVTHVDSFVNVGIYTITITGTGNFTGTHTVDFKILPATLEGVTLVDGSLTYNGKEQEFEISAAAMEGFQTLEVGDDFVIESGSELSGTEAGLYTVFISGTGNFTGEVEVYFEILPADIGGAVFEVDEDVVLTYDGTVLTPDISEVTLNDGVTNFGILTEGVDYIVYVWETNAGKDLTGYVVGTGNFAGLAPFTYEINQRSIENAVVVTGEELVKVYNGEDHSYDLDTVHITDYGTSSASTVRTLADTVEYEGYLINGVDYDVVHDKDCVNVGEYMITINGINNFTGSHTVTFVVVAAPLDKVTLNCGELTYSGNEQKASVVSAEMVGITGSLTLGYDFVIVDESELYATDAGTHYVNIVAGSSGNFSGETKAVFTILPKSIEGAFVGVNGSTSVVYDGTDHVHTITGVSLDGFDSLILGTDYYVEHDHDRFVDAGTYYVSVFGMGNFTGEIDIEFDVLPADISKAELSGDLSFVYDGTEKTFNPTVTSGVGTLKLGTDYFLEIEEGSVRDAGTYHYTITGTKNYEGSMTGTFVIERLDISGALISTGGTLTYDGTSQSADIVVVRIGNLDVTYEVKENFGTDVGLHDIVLVGTGNFTGTATGSFYIAPRSLSGADVTAEEEFTYSGSVQSPVVTNVYLGDIGFALTENTDFVTVLGSGYSADVGTYSYTIHGIGNFTGDIERYVTVTRKDIDGADIVLGESLTYTGKEQTQTVLYVISDGLAVTYKLISGYTAVNAGDYTLIVEGTENFEGTASVVWTMEKAVPVYSVPASLTGFYGHTLATIELTDGWSWVDEHESVGEIGTNTHAAVFTPEDTKNYLTITVSLEVTVNDGGPKVIAIQITSEPYRTEYTAFENFDRAGMVVTVYFDDGTGEILSDYTVTGGESLRYGTDGIQTITVGYMGFTYALTVSVAKITVTTPVAVEGLVYDGTEQFGIDILEEYPSDIWEIFVISGTISATNAGDYKVTLILADTENYSWADGTVTLTWSIGRAAPSVTDVFTEDWVYGGDGTLPTFDTVSDGVVTFMYYRFDEDSEEWVEYGTDMTGAEIGLYAVKIMIAETENCYACESDLYEFYVVAPEEPAEGEGDGDHVGEDVGHASENKGRSGELTTEIIIVLAIIAAAAVVLIIVFGCVTTPKKKP